MKIIHQALTEFSLELTLVYVFLFFMAVAVMMCGMALGMAAFS